MVDHKCNFCKSVFTTKGALKTHIKTAKYCLVKQNIDISPEISCEFCDHIFTQKGSYKTHIKTCESRVIFIHTKEIEDLKTEMMEKVNEKVSELKQEKQYNIEYQQIISEQRNEIIKLKEDLAFEKGKSAGYQTSKPSTVVNKNCNNNVSSKLSHIQITTIKPFTIESISEVLPLYTEACFRNKLQGIMSLILPITTLDVNGVIERNIVCTDLARTVCHRLTDDREWLRDDGLSICKDILKAFAPHMTPYVNVYKEKFEEAERTINNESYKTTKSIHYPQARRDFDTYFEILEDVRTDFYTPAMQGFGENYDTLVKNFRDLLKPAVYVRTIKATPD